MILSDPAQLSRAYDEHHRSVHAVVYRVLGDEARAADVVQDVFLRLWRRPDAFDPARADLGTYLRLLARSRAIDLIREQQARGRMTDRFKLAVADQPPRAERPDELAERASIGRPCAPPCARSPIRKDRDFAHARIGFTKGVSRITVPAPSGPRISSKKIDLPNHRGPERRWTGDPKPPPRGRGESPAGAGVAELPRARQLTP